MKITYSKKEIVKAGETFQDDYDSVTICTDTFTTDKKGLPFNVQVKVVYPYDTDVDSILENAREFVKSLEDDKNQTKINLETGEVV